MPTSSRPVVPRRGEIWLVDFNPTRGSEIAKTRPAVVVSSDSIGKLPIKLVVPVTEWKDWYGENLWHVPVAPDQCNGLDKKSAVDALQIRCVAVERFVYRIGRISPEFMDDITEAIALVIEYR